MIGEYDYNILTNEDYADKFCYTSIDKRMPAEAESSNFVMKMLCIGEEREIPKKDETPQLDNIEEIKIDPVGEDDRALYVDGERDKKLKKYY